MSFRKFLVVFSTGSAGLYASTFAYLKYTTGKCTSNRDLSGQTVIVTGANTGIGLETAKDLAARNARVILACRTKSKGEEAMNDIVLSTGNHNVLVKELDVSSFESVRAFAKDILQTENRLDVLVNNAGILSPPKDNRKSPEGLDLIMATNHFGPFLLTNLLLPKLKKSAPSRIVVVSSMVHEWGKLDPEDPNKENKCKKSQLAMYHRSKLANVLFTRELSERLKGSGVTVNALHPGAVRTELTRDITGISFKFYMSLIRPLFKNAKDGAQTTIHLAVAEELEGVSGKYFSDCKEKEPNKRALDSEAAKKLWDYSEKVTQLNHQ